MPSEPTEIVIPAEEQRVTGLWVTAALMLVTVATLVRLYLNFSHPYPPGTDAGYYPLQTQTLLLRGHLMYDDLPLIFWLNAALSKLLVISGMKFDAAVLVASRILDSIIEPWAAIGIIALGYLWSDGRRKAVLGCTVAAGFAVLSPPVVRMLSDFEKNSIGFVFMSGVVWACRRAMIERTPFAWMRVVLLLGLLAITHLGAFAVTMAIAVTAMAVWSMLSLRTGRRRWGAAAAFCGAAAALVALLALFDPNRAGKLIRAPLALFRLHDMLVLPMPIFIVFAGLIGTSIYLLWRERANLPAADIAIVTALAVVTVLAVCPKSFVYFDRGFLMVTIPASLLLAFIMSKLQSASRTAGFAVLGLFLFAVAAAPAAVQRPLMNREIAAELQKIKKQIPAPEATLVVAPHGLEWWAGYFLGTPVRNAFPSAPLLQYRRVLFLRNTIDCPPELVPPFELPPLKEGSPRIFLGHYVEVYESD